MNIVYMNPAELVPYDKNAKKHDKTQIENVAKSIKAWLKAQETGKPVELCCAIGDETIDGRPYEEIVDIARDFIKAKGGFEKFAEWGLIE